MDKVNNNTDKQNNKKDNVINKEKKQNNIFLNKISMITFIFLLFFIITFVVLFKHDFIKIKNESNLLKKNTNVQVINSEQKNEQDEYLKNIQKLSSSINVIKNEINTLNNDLAYIQSKIDILESSFEQIDISPQRVELIKLVLNIQNAINNNLNYSQDLTILTSLSKNDQFLLDKIIILKRYQNDAFNKKLIQNTFSSEFKIFLEQNNILNKNQNKILNFLSKFIIIRKIKNIENNAIDDFALKIESAINSGNYNAAFDILKNSDYLKYFKKTEKNIEVIVLLNNTIVEMINYLVNN